MGSGGLWSRRVELSPQPMYGLARLYLLELGLPLGLAVLVVPVVLVKLVCRPTPGLDTRVTSTVGGTGPTSDIGILAGSY